MSEIICPNCKKDLEKAVKKKTRCPHCRRDIFVRDGELFSRDEVFVFDWKKALSYYPKFAETVEGQRSILKKRFGREPGGNDLVWGALNVLISEAMSHQHFDDLSTLYGQSARFCRERGNEAQADRLEEESNKMMEIHSANQMKNLNESHFEVISEAEGTIRCPVCSTDMGKPKVKKTFFGKNKYFIVCNNCQRKFNLTQHS